MTDVRYGFQEGMIDNQDIDPEVTYHDSETVPHAAQANPDVFGTDPRFFLTRDSVLRSKIDSQWRGSQIVLPASDGTVWGPVILARGQNDRRSLITFWTTNYTDTENVMLCDAVGNGVAFNPGSALMTFHSTGAYYIRSNGTDAITVNIYEESYA